MSVTHVAGPVVRIGCGCAGTRIIQRCAVCGEKLCDNVNTSMPLNPDGTQPEFPTWAEGNFVWHEGNGWHLIGPFESEPMPEDFCIDLVEE